LPPIRRHALLDHAQHLLTIASGGIDPADIAELGGYGERMRRETPSLARPEGRVIFENLDPSSAAVSRLNMDEEAAAELGGRAIDCIFRFPPMLIARLVQVEIARPPGRRDGDIAADRRIGLGAQPDIFVAGRT
jgi:hypothetical protein